MMPLKYDTAYATFNFSAMVSIYYVDGTVAVSVGGIEMGQGMNSRVCCYTLKYLNFSSWFSLPKRHLF